MKLLERYEFIADRATGSHSVYYHPERHLRVVVPFDRRDAPKGTLVAILKHAGLELYQEVEVASSTILAVQYGPKKREPADAMPPAETGDHFTVEDRFSHLLHQ